MLLCKATYDKVACTPLKIAGRHSYVLHGRRGGGVQGCNRSCAALTVISRYPSNACNLVAQAKDLL